MKSPPRARGGAPERLRDLQDGVVRFPHFPEGVYHAKRPHAALGSLGPAHLEAINARKAA